MPKALTARPTPAGAPSPRGAAARRPGPRGRQWSRPAVGVLFLLLCGCRVPQPRGHGELKRCQERSTGRTYYLYLPEDYVAADPAERAQRRWPLVVSFHGMRPYDKAKYQALEWEYEADRYGYIVVAPQVKAFTFVLGEFPLRTLTAKFRADEAATLAILDEVLAEYPADPNRVLSTAWSSGGYMAHYMINRHPDRFTCLAVRQSNFASTVLDSDLTIRSLYHPILILSTQHDVGICRQESRDAIRWYESHGYRNLAWIYLTRLGHERTPDTAAAFFARLAGVTPKHPPEVLVGRQALEGNAAGLALLAGRFGSFLAPPATRDEPDQSAPALASAALSRPILAVDVPALRSAAPPDASLNRTMGVPPGRSPAPPRNRSRDSHRPAPPLLSIRLPTAIGFAPLDLLFSAECPPDWSERAEFTWRLNDRAVGSGSAGQTTITSAGDHSLEVLAVLPDGSVYRAQRHVRVLRSTAAPPVTAAPRAR